MNEKNKSARKGIRRSVYMQRDLEDDIARVAILDNRSFSTMLTLLCRKGLDLYMEQEEKEK